MPGRSTAPPSPPSPPSLADELTEVVGRPHVLCDPEVTAGYCTDWTGRFRGQTPMVVRPGSTEEVAAVLAACRRSGATVVPQGGNTGLVGGGVPLGGEVVVSLQRLQRLDEVDTAAAQVTAGAGVTLADLHHHVRRAGLAYGVDLASRDSATVGGTVATNAGGLHVLRFGSTRHQVLGVEAVLGDGSVISHLGGLVKDNTGYDLPGLLCGSEGTLGIVTAVRLRLVPRYERRVVAILAVRSVDDVVAVVSRWRRSLAALQAAELILEEGLELVCSRTGRSRPVTTVTPAYLLVEAADHDDPSDRLARLVAAEPAVVDAAVATSEERMAHLWSYREDHTLVINQLGPPHKLDVTLPAGQLARFVASVPEAVSSAAPGARTWQFGHVGDGNIHVNVTGVPADDLVTGGALDDAVLRLAAALGGSISAEHGIGTAKRRWLHLNRSPQEIAAFRAVKRALDPDGILNPNALLPPSGHP